MSGKKDELPGYYRDPKTGKYYREKPESTANPSLKKLKRVREEEASKQDHCKRPEISNVLKYLRSRELGLISGLQSEREYFKMRTYGKRMIEEISLNDYQPHYIASVDLIKGGKNSVLGVWNIKEKSKYRCVVGERTYIGLPFHPTLGFKACRNFAIDLCEGPENTIVCLFNHPFSGVGSYAFLPQTTDNIDIYTTRWGSPLYCCSSARGGSSFAFGCEGFIRYYTRFSCEKTYFVKGRVHSVAFNDSSNLMFSGVHSGHLYVHDVREKLLKMEFHASNYCINDLWCLDSEQVVITGPGNVLSKVDLRMRKSVTEYFGHKSSVKKRPISVANGMLCAPGADNIIRIWHLSGGNPLHEMKPVNSPENETRGWLYGDCSKTFLYQFEEFFKRIYEIT